MHLEIHPYAAVLSFLYTVMSVLFLGYLWPVKRANPVFWFIIFQWIMAFGTFFVVDPMNGADMQYVSLFFAALVSFACGGILVQSATKVRTRYVKFFASEIIPDHPFSISLTVIIAIFSALICILYYRIIGYNLFNQVVLSAEILDFKTARIGTYSGEIYYAPGYVNQFKNVLYPTSMFAICFWLYPKLSRAQFLILCAIVAYSCLYFLMGTGQRAPFVYVFVGLVFGIFLLLDIRLTSLLPAFAALVFLFGLFSVLNERIESLSAESAIFSLVKRVFVNDQEEGLWGFQYVLTLPSNDFSDWADSFLGILPSRSGSNLPHELYFRIHNTYRGTSSLTAVGSAYYNGGIFTVFGLYFCLGIGYAATYVRLLSGKRTVLRSLSYGGAIFLMAVYVAGPPVVFLNKGFLGFVLLLLVRKIRFGKQPTNLYHTASNT